MSISQNFPNIQPTLNLPFALTKILDPRVTFTRAASAVYYDGKTVAKAEENLLIRSQEFNDAYWTKTNSSITTNATTAPDGTNTGNKLNVNTTNGQHNVKRNALTPLGTTSTISVFAKANELSWLVLTDDVAFGVYFDLTNGAKGSNIGTPIDSSIVSVGNGWYRCSVTFTSGSVNSGISIIATTNNAVLTFAGANTTDSIYIWGAQLEQRSAVTDYTPTTTQAITNYVPQLLTAASGVARFDHNPTTGESLGLLVEEQRTNLLTYSEQFNDASWTKTDITLTVNSNIAPDGALTAALLTEGSAGTAVLVRTAGAVVSSGATVTSSVFVKRSALIQWARFRLTTSAGTNGCNVWFDIQNGILGAVANVGSGTASSGSITAVGNSWYRISVTTTLASGDTTALFQLISASANSSTTRVSGAAYFIWGAQLEAGAAPSSYIPTVASQVTRAADAASMTGANFSSWFNQQQGSLYVEATPRQTGLQYVAIIGDGVNNSLGIGFFIENSELEARVRGSGGLSTITGGLIVSANTSFKTALSYAAYNNAWATNGGTQSTGNTNIKPENSATLQIGSSPVGSTNLTGTIRKIAYYPARLTDAQLQAITG
jgi:hypothetical protein